MICLSVSLLLSLLAAQSQCHSIVDTQNADGLEFLILGDWGGMPYPFYTTDLQRTVAGSMGKTAATFGASFVVALGDNFYFTGVENEDSTRFIKTFEDVYTSSSLQIPWYVIAGNHDHYGNVTGQIDYTRHSNLWKFPNFYHSHEFTIPGTSMSVQIILIDTVLLCGHSGHDHHPKPLTGPESPELADEQLKWIEKSLAASTADYIIVGGHYPVWSIGNHGPTSQLIEQLKPLLEKYNVNAYICGHDHNMQVIQENNSTVQYLVIGNANFMDGRTTHASKVPTGSSKFFYYEGGYARASVTNEQMTVLFYGADEKLLYQIESKPRRKEILV